MQGIEKADLFTSNPLSVSNVFVTVVASER